MARWRSCATDNPLLWVAGATALLALMLFRANELVRIEELVEMLFGEQPADTSVNAVRVAV